MELWWWIIPLLISAIPWAIIFLLLSKWFESLDCYRVAAWLAWIGALPGIIAILSAVLWVIIRLFYSIWSPFI